MNYKQVLPENSCLDIEKLQENIKQLGISQQKNFKISLEQIYQLLKIARKIFLDQPTILDLQAPIKIIGDIHGHLKQLLLIYKYCGYPSNNNYLFLGNYVDKGKYSIQVLCLQIIYKIKYPQNFYMLRGNHQMSDNNRIFGLYQDCKKRYNLFLWKEINQLFNCMPLCAVIDHHIFCVHSGLSPQLPKYEELAKIARPYQIQKNQGIVYEILTSQPDSYVNNFTQQQLGQGFLFGCDILHSWMIQNNFELIVRGNCILQNGFQFFYNKKLISLCSIPNMQGLQNLGAILCVSQQLKCHFQIIKTSSEDIKKK